MDGTAATFQKALRQEQRLETDVPVSRRRSTKPTTLVGKIEDLRPIIEAEYVENRL